LKKNHGIYSIAIITPQTLRLSGEHITIIDACTKELLAWVLSESLEIDFVLETVNQLIENYGISLTAATLLNSDQAFYGYMKDEIDISQCTTFEGIHPVISDWTDYYNIERYQWNLARLAQGSITSISFQENIL